MSSNIDLGLVTAYGYAVDAGFTGTEAEFAQMLANIVVYKNAAETAANDAALSAGLAEQYKDEAFDTTPAGYTDFVSDTNSSLDDLYNNNVKNLFRVTANSTEINDEATITINDDGTILLNGSNTTSDEYYYEIGRFSFETATSIHFSACPTQIGTPTYAVQCYKISPWGFQFTETGSGRDFDCEANTKYLLRVALVHGNTYNNVLLKPMLTLKGVPNSDYAHFKPYASSNRAITEVLEIQDRQIDSNTNISNSDTLQELCEIDISGEEGVYLIQANVNHSNAYPTELHIDVYHNAILEEAPYVETLGSVPLHITIPYFYDGVLTKKIVLKAKWNADVTGCTASLVVRKIMGVL